MVLTVFSVGGTSINFNSKLEHDLCPGLLQLGDQDNQDHDPVIRIDSADGDIDDWTIGIPLATPASIKHLLISQDRDMLASKTFFLEKLTILSD